MLAELIANMRRKEGFTLIETLVYLALLGLVFTGLMASAFAMAESIDRVKMKAIVQEEANFIMAKINWASAGDWGVVKPVNIANPTSGNSGTELGLRKSDGSDYYLRFRVSVGDLQFQDVNSTVWLPLNNSTIDVTPTSPATTFFTHTGSIGGNDPESISFNFTLKAKTPMGKDYTQDFQLTNYLRK